MFRSVLKKIFSTKSPKHIPKQPMASNVRLRYLQNELPEYQPGITVTVPEDDIRKQIFSYVEDIKKNIEANESNGKDGLYLGTAGIAYMFYHLSSIPQLHEYRSTFLNQAREYLLPALKVCSYEVNDTDIPAFLLGNAGVYAVASAVYSALGEENESNRFRQLFNGAAKTCKNMNFLSSGSDELFVGRAGYVCGALWMSKETKTAFKIEDIFDICRIIITSGRQYSNQNKSPSPLMYSYYNVEYIGAGHGICTILQILLSVPGFLDGNPKDVADVKASVDYVLTLQDNEGNFPAATDEIHLRHNKLVHWCHGAGGVIYLMAKAYLTWNEEKYINACKRAADLIWEKGLLRKGPGLCHGVAGNGYTFLLMYRLTKDVKYLHRALQFASFLHDKTFKNVARIPDNPHSLFEGVAGTVCFLGDLLNPSNAAFPFCDVF